MKFILSVFTILIASKDAYPFMSQKHIDSSYKIKYYEAIQELENQILNIPHYIIDSTYDLYIATDPRGYFTFEMYKAKICKEQNIQYSIKIKSYFHGKSEYFKFDPPELFLKYKISYENDEELVKSLVNLYDEPEMIFANSTQLYTIYREKMIIFVPDTHIVFGDPFYSTT